MDLDNNTAADTTEDSFGVTIAKTMAISVASTAGMIIGLAVVGVVVDKYSERRTARAAKKNTTIQTEK